MTQFTDRRGQVGRFTYDPLNGLVLENYQDGAMVSRAYEAYSRLQAVNDSAGGLFTFGYDLRGALISQSGPTGSLTYSRDALGRMASRQVAGQPLLTYSYDAVPNLTAAAMLPTGVSTTYDSRNLPTAMTRTNGVTTSYSFDPAGQLLSLTHAKGAAALSTLVYGYDAGGCRTAVQNNLSQPFTTQAAVATVDEANELLTNGAASYTYDANADGVRTCRNKGVQLGQQKPHGIHH